MPVDYRERWEVNPRRVWFGTQFWHRISWWSFGRSAFYM